MSQGEELPVAPHAVKHSLMNVKSRVTRRGKKVTARVTTVDGWVLDIASSLVAKGCVDLADDTVSAAVRADFEWVLYGTLLKTLRYSAVAPGYLH